MDERWKDMLDDIQKKRHALDMLNPFSSFMQSFFDNMFDGDDEFFDGAHLSYRGQERITPALAALARQRVTTNHTNHTNGR